ncbi:manganese ion binding protein [Aureococcus anophagefferens]|nr:manganese ion binding protein [Aureococcus anophagefferens]
MLAADSHLGYLDRDPVRGGDSFAAFEEVPLGVLRPRRFSRDFDRVLSDQAANYAAGVNFEDPHAAVALPVFAVHGNHDDPTRDGGLAEDGATYFSVLVLHQNREAGRGRNACVHESMIPEWFDLVVWGHEHECLVEPRPIASERGAAQLRARRAGPSRAPPAGDGEARPKHCGLLQIRGDEFRLEPLRLTSRAAVRRPAASALQRTCRRSRAAPPPAAATPPSRTRSPPRSRRSSRPARASRQRFQHGVPPRGAGPRLAARVDRTRFGDVRAARRALRRRRREPGHGAPRRAAAAAAAQRRRASARPVEGGELDAVQIEDLVQGHLDADESKLQVLPEDKMNRALEDFVRKAKGGAFAELVEQELARTQRRSRAGGPFADEAAVRDAARGAAPGRGGGSARWPTAAPGRAPGAPARRAPGRARAPPPPTRTGRRRGRDEDEAAAEAPPKKSAGRRRASGWRATRGRRGEGREAAARRRRRRGAALRRANRGGADAARVGPRRGESHAAVERQEHGPAERADLGSAGGQRPASEAPGSARPAAARPRTGDPSARASTSSAGRSRDGRPRRRDLGAARVPARRQRSLAAQRGAGGAAAGTQAGTAFADA